VGAYAVQLAAHAGATVIATASGDDEAYLNSIGAGGVIDYREAQFEKVLREKVDVVFDCDQERDVHAGGLAFIPSVTWVSLKNTGTEPVSLTFIFSAPGFEDTMRCNSVAAGEAPTQITPEQQRDCAHEGHAEYASRPEQPQK
jgi:NADPH:quinone reductase-like Zn-dependent oxidoreductase